MLVSFGLSLASLSLVAFDAPPLLHYRPDHAAIARDLTINFTVSITQQNLDKLVATAHAVSDPASPRYGSYLSQNEIDALTAPAAQDVGTVTAWLSSHGAKYTLRHADAHVTTTVAVAERLLQTNFRGLISRSGQQLVRAGTYHLPSTVDAAVATIFGLHGVPLPTVPPRFSSVAATAVPVTPAVLASTYAVNQTVNRNGPNIQAVSEFQNQLMAKKDLATFFKQLVPNAQPGDEKVFKFVGAPYQTGAGAEADLDIQYIMGAAPGVKTEFWEYPSTDFCADLNTYTAQILSSADGPFVHSISYGWQGNLSVVGCKPSDIAVVDANWAKLAARGISILISSGDGDRRRRLQLCELPLALTTTPATCPRIYRWSSYRTRPPALLLALRVFPCAHLAMGSLPGPRLQLALALRRTSHATRPTHTPCQRTSVWWRARYSPRLPR